MSSIPADVFKAAIDIAQSAEPGVVVNSVPGAVYVARAIIAERERLAAVMEAMPDQASAYALKHAIARSFDQ